MSNSPLAQAAVDRVRAWLDASDVVTTATLSVAQRKQHVAAWELKEKYPHLGAIRPRILLPQDFPFAPLRIELDPQQCLRLPHVEASGNFCHGVLPDPADLDEPVWAAGRVLEQFLDYVRRSADAEWVEEEFHRESHDYWLRHADAANPPKSCQTDELLLEVDPDIQKPQRVEALNLASRTRAIVSTREGGPKAAAEAIGWSLGTIVGGSALVTHLPQNRRWTPSTWPKSFESLTALIDEITGASGVVAAWYMSRQWSNEAPMFVVLLQIPAAFGWRIIPPRARASSHSGITPIKVTRFDRRWTLARDHQSEQLALTRTRVVVFGCGSLGAPVIELLARAGVGTIEVVDPDIMRPENVSRHPLGIRSNSCYKATEICNRLKNSVPGVKATPHNINAQQWLAAGHPEPDLILDCTGERAVRMAVSQVRSGAQCEVPIMMGWMEPFGAAAHVVTIVGTDVWPASDPAETAINIGQWPDDVELKHLGCGQGFHLYGMSDAWKAAAVMMRRAIALLQGEDVSSDVVSLVQSRAYFERSSPGITFHRRVRMPSGIESVVERRLLSDALNGL